MRRPSEYSCEVETGVEGERTGKEELNPFETRVDMIPRLQRGCHVR
jgi:hypothetical protein